jgi:hypothetical protein
MSIHTRLRTYLERIDWTHGYALNGFDVRLLGRDLTDYNFFVYACDARYIPLFLDSLHE